MLGEVWVVIKSDSLTCIVLYTRQPAEVGQGCSGVAMELYRHNNYACALLIINIMHVNFALRWIYHCMLFHYDTECTSVFNLHLLLKHARDDHFCLLL